MDLPGRWWVSARWGQTTHLQWTRKGTVNAWVPKSVAVLSPQGGEAPTSNRKVFSAGRDLCRAQQGNNFQSFAPFPPKDSDTPLRRKGKGRKEGRKETLSFVRPRKGGFRWLVAGGGKVPLLAQPPPFLPKGLRAPKVTFGWEGGGDTRLPILYLSGFGFGQD